MLKYSEQELRLKPLRGKRLPVRVKTTDGYSSILNIAILKFKTYFPELYDENLPYTLCFENGNEALYMPGEDIAFELQKYKDEIGKDYKRIVLFLCANEELYAFNDDLEVEERELNKLEPPTKKEKKPSMQLNVTVNSYKPVDLTNEKKRSITCPICNQKFPCDKIEQHADNCAMNEENIFVCNLDEELNETNDFQFNDEVPGSSTDTVVNDIQFKETIAAIIEGQTNATTQILRVVRGRCWENYSTHCEKKWFDKKCSLQVTFINDVAVGTKGPRRDFFQDAINEMKAQCFVNGEPVDSTSLLVGRKYFFAGQLLAQSLLQGGPTPNVLAEWCYELLANITKKSTIEPSPAFLEKSYIKMLLDAPDEQSYQNNLMGEEVLNILSDIGYRGVPSKARISERQQLIESIYYHEVVAPKIPALWQLAEGLNVRQLLDHIKSFSSNFKKYFVVNANDLQVSEFIDWLFPIFSDKGSNKESKETIVYKFLCDFIEYSKYDENSQVKIEGAFRFMTGCETMPYGGLDDKINVYFKFGCEACCKCLPIVSLCASTLTIPVHMADSFELFSGEMEKAILLSHGFGRL